MTFVRGGDELDKKTIAEMLRKYGCEVLIDEPMSSHTSFRIGGTADFFVTASVEQVADVRGFCDDAAIPFLVIGNGSNLLVSDRGIDGVVLQVASSAPLVDGCYITATAGLSLAKLCIAACENGLSGLEFAYGIPGTVGGGVYMNAGAYGGELADVLQSVTALKSDGTVVTLQKDDLKLGYRHSVFMEQPLIVLQATFALEEDNKAAIRSRMDEFLSRRKEKQPLEFPSGGSFFKRPTGHFAGALIEQCGLKGLSVGGAQISEKHAGFLLNRGDATCADVMELCRQVQQRVQEAYGVELEREVQVIGR